MTLDEARGLIGREVRYESFPDPEFGIITSVGTACVFVRYDGDRHAKATSPEDLTLTMERRGPTKHR